nr:hypothetical protein [uncultured bacterium]
MDSSKIDPEWPNSLRWFLCQGLNKFTPWHFVDEPSEHENIARIFKGEDRQHRNIFVFANRQDRDGFAGLLIVDGKITSKVVCFHPTFASAESILSSSYGWNIVIAEFEDVFDFVAKIVVPDMKDWALMKTQNIYRSA